MAEAAAPKQKTGARAPSRRDAFLDLLFAVLNFILSGPPGWQHVTQQSVQQQKSNGRTNLLWGASLGGMLGIILACSFYFGVENTTPNLFNDQLTGIAGYVLLVGLGFFLVGLLCGRGTGSGNDGMSIVFIACLVQALTALILLIVFSLVFNLWAWDHDGLMFMLFGIDIESGSIGVGYWLVTILFWQIVLGTLDTYIGGLIGRRFLHRQIRAEGRADR